jgi:hypothetical protein
MFFVIHVVSICVLSYCIASVLALSAEIHLYINFNIKYLLTEFVQSDVPDMCPHTRFPLLPPIPYVLYLFLAGNSDCEDSFEGMRANTTDLASFGNIFKLKFRVMRL